MAHTKHMHMQLLFERTGCVNAGESGACIALCAGDQPADAAARRWHVDEPDRAGNGMMVPVRPNQL